MGITAPVAKMILAEHKYKKITGNLLTCGRQTIYIKANDAINFLKKQGVSPREGVDIKLDDYTRESEGEGWISDVSFFELFTDVNINAVDHSDYEKANIIHDMCKPIGIDLQNRFDFIFNGSCMDNLFNPAQFLINTSKMLRPGGVVVHFEHSSTWPGAYLMYSPEYFFDFFAVNKYSDCKVYLALFRENPVKDYYNVFQWDPIKVIDESILSYGQPEMFTLANTIVIVIAEKGNDSTNDVSPIQHQYRPKEMQNNYFESAIRFRQSPRPIIISDLHLPIEYNNYQRYCGTINAE